MSFTIITTVSPDFARCERQFIPTWHANAGADEIVVHRIDEGSWAGNILKRTEIIQAELMERLPHGEKVLFLDADCIVLKDLSGGFSDQHVFSLARWPYINMGVFFVNLDVPFQWQPWLGETVAAIQQEAMRPDRLEAHGYDQDVWQPRLLAMADVTRQLDECEWNYNFGLSQWRRELPGLRGVTRVLHFKGHGDSTHAKVNEKLEVARRLWTRELKCMPV